MISRGGPLSVEGLPGLLDALTQHTLAKTLDVKQAEISKIETCADSVVTWRCERSSPNRAASTGKENQPTDRRTPRVPE